MEAQQAKQFNIYVAGVMGMAYFCGKQRDVI